MISEMVEGSLMLLLQKNGLKGLENFQTSDRQFCGTGIRLDLVDPRDGIRSNSRKYQGDPRKGELLLSQNHFKMDLLVHWGGSSLSLDRFEEHLGKYCGSSQYLEDTGIV